MFHNMKYIIGLDKFVWCYYVQFNWDLRTGRQFKNVTDTSTRINITATMINYVL